MKASVVICRDPFRPAHNRTTSIVRKRHTLADLAPRTGAPVVCQLNGQWISRANWSNKIADGDSVVFVQLPQGGGGGGGSNPLKMVLTIAIMYYAPYMAEGMLGTETVATGLSAMGMSSQTFVMIAKAGIGFLGSALVNAMIPPPKPPSAQQASSYGGLAAPSPTYSLGAQGNSARLGQPIPVIYGRHIVYPDFAAMPYLEYAGNEQYLYQLFALGQGEYDIESINIEDTPISSFSEIDYEIVAPGGSVTLFPTSVVTSAEVSGQEALTSTTLGPFVANAAGTLANHIAVDVVMSRGLYYANDSGGLDAMSVAWTVEAQLIDDLGAPTGSWFVLGNETVSAATTTPQRKSYKYAVTSGRYRVRLTRTDSKATDSRYGHELDWAGLRVYLPGAQEYGNITVVAMRMRATNNLSSQASRKINFVVTRKLPTWTPGGGWTVPVATRSIAWALADVARATYGAALADARVDLQGLYDLDAVWAARDDTFDGIFDSQSTIMEALTQISRAGRAVPFIQGGIVHSVRDSAETLPVALFSQRNIVRNSLKLEYIMPSEESADAVDVTYFDEDIWSERTVRATLVGGTSTKPARVKLFGVTDRGQAWREGMYIAACNRYRRRTVTFETEMEGFIPALSDLIAVQHDLPKWGQSGEVVAWDTPTKTAILSEPLDWSAGGAHKLALRRRDGSVAGPYTATAGADDYHVVLSDWVSGTDPVPDVGGDRERTHYAFGPTNSQYIRCRVLGIKPKSPETAEIMAVVESDYVHTADAGAAPGVTAWQLPTKFTVPVVAGLTARSMPDDPDKMVVSWQPAAGADYYLIEQSAGDNTWTRVGEVSSATFTAIALYGPATIVRVAAIGMTRGPWVEIAYGQLASYYWTGDANLMWSSDSAALWRY